MIRVELPYHLRNLAKISGETSFDIDGTATLRTLLDVLEAKYPVLRGTIRDQVSGERRAFIRFFACNQDLSLDSPDKPLPDDIVSGKEPLLVIGAIAGG